MVVTLALVGILASTALPLYEVTVTRQKEAELRLALRTIRNALDAYKAAADSGQIVKGATESGYPPTLEVLVNGVDLPNAPTGAPTKIYFLRHIPRRPVCPGSGAVCCPAVGAPQLRQSARRSAAGCRCVRCGLQVAARRQQRCALRRMVTPE